MLEEASDKMFEKRQGSMIKVYRASIPGYMSTVNDVGTVSNKHQTVNTNVHLSTILATILSKFKSSNFPPRNIRQWMLIIKMIHAYYNISADVMIINCI